MKKIYKISLAFLTFFCFLFTVCAFLSFNWKKAYGETTGNITEDSTELPLDSLVENGGLVKIFDKIACIGDSLSSGALEEHSAVGTIGHDEYQYSWGQYMARTLGNTVYNFSKGGMTASVYCESFAQEQGFWSDELACDAYYIALGVNDFFTYPGSIEIGSTADIAENWQDNQKTFAGYIGQIVQRLQDVNSDAVFFFITLPSDGDDAYRVGIQKEHAALMYDLAEYFDNSFVIDLGKYAPTYDEEFKSNYYVGGHLSTSGYYFTSKMIMSYTDYIIRHNTQAFRQRVRQFYIDMLLVAMDGQASAPEVPDEILAYTVITRSGKKYDYRFYDLSTRKIYFTVDGEGEFCVARDDVERVVGNLDKLIHGETITSSALGG